MSRDVITVSWFSGGVSSAVATKLAIDHIDKIIYQHIDDQHKDTIRFVKECEAWFGKPVEIQQSPYKCVESVCKAMGFINGPHGAVCTRLLKKRLRQEWESQHRFFCTFNYIWGMDNSPRERNRADMRREEMREDEHEFPLIDRELTKEDAHGILKEAGIRRPEMYDMGYPNNNCIGCVKGGAGYWNKIRVDFPEVFKSRCAMERLIGRTCLKQDRPDKDRPAGADNSILFYLDELDPNAGRDCQIVVPECGVFCETIKSEGGLD